MLVDALNLIGMPLPNAADAASAASAAAPVQPKRAGGARSAPPAPSDLEVWASHAAGDVQSRAETVRRWAAHLVDAEFERSQSGGWRRLIPNHRGEFLPFLARESRPLNSLAFRTC